MDLYGIATYSWPHSSQRLRTMLGALEGPALDQYLVLGSAYSGLEPKTDAELLEYFKNIFQKEETSLERELRFRTRLQFSGHTADSLEKYITKFLHEVAATPRAMDNHAEEEYIRIFLRGSPSEEHCFTTTVAAQIKDRWQTTTNHIDLLLKLSRTYTGLLVASKRAPQGFSISPAPQTLTTTPVPMEGIAVTQTQHHHESGSHPYHRSSPTLRCYGCGGFGHRVWQCPSPSSSRVNHPTFHQSRQLYRKNKHSKDSWKSNRRQGAHAVIAEDDTMNSAETEINSDMYSGLLMDYACTIVIHGGKRSIFIGQIKTLHGWRTITILVDSGASRNLVSEQLAKILRRDKLEGSSCTVFQFANGTLYTSNKRCPQVELTIGPTYKTKVDLNVCAMKNFDIILGQTWLQKENPQIDWRTGTMTIKGIAVGQHDLETTNTAEPVESQEKTRTKIDVISAHQMHRMLRKPAMINEIAALIPKACETQNENSSTTVNVTHTDLKPIVEKFQHLFSEPTDLPPQRPGHDHHIHLIDGTQPPYRRPFRLSNEETEELTKQLNELLKKEYIRPSSSPYGAPVLFARKKDGGLRLCIDYRLLNKLTIRDRYPLPDIAEMLDAMHDSTIFSKLDCRSGYHQVRMAEDSVEKTAFVTHLGAFEWRVLPMGLTNAPPTFQRLMNHILGPYRAFTRVYLDDIIIFSKSTTEHMRHVETILQTLAQNHLKLHPKKCEFGKESLIFLGFEISHRHVSPEAGKLKAVMDWSLPRSVKELMSFLGFCNYYRKFVRNFATIATPLTNLLRNRTERTALPNPLPTEAIQAFQALKEALSSAPSLYCLHRRINSSCIQTLAT